MPKVHIRCFLKASFLVLVGAASAAKIAGAVTIPTVPIGNAGNFNDASGYGQVFYDYRIGTYEVTNGQYAEFLNAKDPTGANPLALYNANMANNANGGILYNAAGANGAKYSVKSGRANQPVVYVSWYDAARFTNWLHNGQGNGNTEDGAYTLLGGGPTPTNQFTITRNPNAAWFLPSETEWYKAAYHKNDGPTGDYWLYPTGTSEPPISDQPSGAPGSLNLPNSANYHFNDNMTVNGFNDGFAVTGTQVFNSLQNYLTDVGAYTLTKSPYGVFDMAGNVWEWNEDFIGVGGGNPYRSNRGGSWERANTSSKDGKALMVSTAHFDQSASAEFETLGFRVAATAVPEPGSALIGSIAFAALTLFARRRRR